MMVCVMAGVWLCVFCVSWGGRWLSGWLLGWLVSSVWLPLLRLERGREGG
jgi:hypothetical protein